MGSFLGLYMAFQCALSSSADDLASRPAAETSSPEKKRKMDGDDATPAGTQTGGSDAVQAEGSKEVVEKNAAEEVAAAEKEEAWPAGLEDFASFRFTGKLRPFPRTPKMEPPEGCSFPDYATHPQGASVSELKVKRKNIPVLEGEELETMREACRLGREVLDIAGQAVKVGITGDDIDKIVWRACAERKLYPSPLGYSGFPKSVCVSVNEVICHGIPDERPFEDGDIVNLDVSVFHNGFHSDLNETFLVGQCDENSHTLVRASYEALQECSKMLKPGTLYRELGAVIEDTAAKYGCKSVPDFCGHGVGKLFHGPPDVPHYRRNKAFGVMKPGHVFTVEPMLNFGKSGRSKQWPDDWTQVTTTGQRSSQYEHTFLITETGCEVLTARVGTDRTCMPPFDPAVFQR